MKASQTGWLIIGIFFPITLFLVFLVYKAGIKDSSAVMILGSVTVVMIACLLIFYKLTISIDNNELKFWFGIGLISKKYKLDEIKECKPVTNSPLYGWGIRMTPDGWLYNVSGLKAIELSFKNSRKKIRIGTNRPEEIAAYLNQLLTTSGDQTNEEIKQRSFRRPLFWGIIIVVILSIGLIFYYGMKEPKVIISADGVQIKGMYGLSINWKEINELDTVAQLPKITLRTNGFAFGKTLTGHFKLEGGSKVLLFVKCNNHPYIRVTYNQEKTLYLNLSDPLATRKLYQKLSEVDGKKR
jgi:hypothetical protein